MSGNQPQQLPVRGKDEKKSTQPKWNVVPKYTTTPVGKPRPEPNGKVHSAPTETISKDPAAAKGAQYSVITNYIAVRKWPKTFHKYRVDIEPPKSEEEEWKTTQAEAEDADDADSSQPTRQFISRRAERKRVFAALRSMIPLQNRNDFATDYDFIWTIGSLWDHSTQTTYLLGLVTYTKQSGQQRAVNVTIVHEHTANFSGAADLIGPVTENSNRSIIGSGLNGLITKFVAERPNTDVIHVNANKFFVRSSGLDITGLLARRGYFSSVRPGNDSVLLNVNITHTAFFKAMLVSDFLGELERNRYFGNDPAQHYDRETILKGVVVRVAYDRQSHDGVNKNLEQNRKKTIAGIGKPPAQQKFVANGVTQTVLAYFRSLGLQTLNHPSLPCINSWDKWCWRIGENASKQPENSREIWIPPELLEIEPDQVFSKQLASGHMDQMGDFACKSPAHNYAAIHGEALQLLGISDAAACTVMDQQLGLRTGQGLLRIPATRLSQPQVEYRRQDRPNLFEQFSPAEASWDLRKRRFHVPGLSTQLRVLDARYGRQDTMQLVTQYARIAVSHGALAADPDIRFGSLQIPVLAQGAVLTPFRTKFDAVTKNLALDEKPFLLVFLDKANVDQYALLKFVADKNGVNTSCITKQKLSKKNPTSIFANVALKHNIKLNGQNHRVLDSSRQVAFRSLFEGGRRTLVLGVDVVHHGGVKPSIAAMVGSLDRNFSAFGGSMRLQPARREVLTDANMTSMALERLQAWKESNPGSLPTHVLYYRDGVGEDQYDEVYDKEVPEIQKAFNKLLGANSTSTLRITVIIVGKRHNTRFFPMPGANAMADDNGNIFPGLLVNKVITMPTAQPTSEKKYSDFFLQSHKALKGTARSAHYVIIRNDDDRYFHPGFLYDLTHAFCYNYARSTTGVSFCAPAYYADKLCERGSLYLRILFRLGATMRPPNPNEKQQDYEATIATDLSNHGMWNWPGRSNPWSASLDKTMFWL